MKAEIYVTREELRLIVERSLAHLVPSGHEVTMIEMRSYSNACLIVIEPVPALPKDDGTVKPT